jgi:hypothetical protein
MPMGHMLCHLRMYAYVASAVSLTYVCIRNICAMLCCKASSSSDGRCVLAPLGQFTIGLHHNECRHDMWVTKQRWLCRHSNQAPCTATAEQGRQYTRVWVARCRCVGVRVCGCAAGCCPTCGARGLLLCLMEARLHGALAAAVGVGRITIGAFPCATNQRGY